MTTATAQAASARVLCCTATPHPNAMDALARYAPGAEVIDVTGDNYAYWREIRSRWTGERDLVIIEQDIEISSDTVASLEQCDQDWCVFAYPIFRTEVRLRVGLGCTKVSAAAQRKVTAAAVAQGFELCAQCRGQGCWWHLDGRISAMLKRAGFFPHVHGDVKHHHDYWAHEGANVDGKPIEWFFEGDLDNCEAAMVIDPDLMGPMIALPDAPRSAIALANDLLRLHDELKDNPGHTASLGVMAPFPLGVVPAPRAYNTDKVSQGYLPAYSGIADLLGPAARVCEVGVWHGGSLATWRDLFPKGLIAGVDIDPDALWPDGTVKIVASQDDPALPDLLREHAPAWDLIVDDASHDGILTGATLDLLWPLVSPGGYYVIEDWFVGYPEYSGMCKSPEMLAVAESLLQRLRSGTDTESVSYRYGMAIIRKKA